MSALLKKQKITACVNQAEKMQALWQNKEYRNFPVIVLEHITQDQSISGEAMRFWIKLFTLAYFEQDWAVQMSKKELGSQMGKSPASIRRHLAELEKAGYLAVEKNTINNVWYASTMFVKIPELLLTALEKAPDRQQGTKDHNHLELIVDNSKAAPRPSAPSSSAPTIKHEQLPYQLCKGGTIKVDTTNKNNIKLNNNTNNKREKTSKNTRDDSSVVDISRKANQEKPSNTSMFHWKPSENIEILKERIKLLENELEPMSQKMKELPLHEKAKFYEEWLEPKHKKQRALRLQLEQGVLVEMQQSMQGGDVKEKLQQQEGRLLQAKIDCQMLVVTDIQAGQSAKDRLVAEQEKLTHMQMKLEKLQAKSTRKERMNATDYLTKGNQRSISSKQCDWLKGKVDEIISDSEEAAIVMNEIAFQVRFGNLQRSYKTNREMTVQHALNVGVKTLREGVWSRPNGMPRVA